MEKTQQKLFNNIWLQVAVNRSQTSWIAKAIKPQTIIDTKDMLKVRDADSTIVKSRKAPLIGGTCFTQPQISADGAVHYF